MARGLYQLRVPAISSRESGGANVTFPKKFDAIIPFED
jgi:hypothetical protein